MPAMNCRASISKGRSLWRNSRGCFATRRPKSPMLAGGWDSRADRSREMKTSLPPIRRRPRWSHALALLVAGVASARAWRDRAGLQEAEDKLRRLDRQYAMISGITALGIRVKDREDLFSNACRIAVELGEFEMAWIALVDRAENRIVPMGWAGLDERAMAAIKDLFATCEGTLEGRTLAAQAIREKGPIVSNDVENDVGLIFGKMHAAAGVRSIRSEERRVG